MSKLEFLPNTDGMSDDMKKVWPIGTTLKWMHRGTSSSTVITVLEYSLCHPDGCEDCDTHRYIDTEHIERCHYRKPDSRYGLCYWEKVDG